MRRDRPQAPLSERPTATTDRPAWSVASGETRSQARWRGRASAGGARRAETNANESTYKGGGEVRGKIDATGERHLNRALFLTNYESDFERIGAYAASDAQSVAKPLAISRDLVRFAPDERAQVGVGEKIP